MRIGGFQKFSLSDFPGCAAAIVFTQGCNFRCPFCHNSSLIPMKTAPQELIPEDELFGFLGRRRGQLDGVVVTGGEPTLQPDLRAFLRRIKEIGFKTKLDTNGSRPDVLRNLFQEGLVDYVAMDIKAPLAIYSRLAGVSVPTQRIAESIDRIARSGIAHEFRTTVVEPLLSQCDLAAVQAMVPAGSSHRLNAFQHEYALDSALRTCAPASGEQSPPLVEVPYS